MNVLAVNYKEIAKKEQIEMRSDVTVDITIS